MTDFTGEQSHEVNAVTAGAQVGGRIAQLAGGGWVVAWTSTGADGNNEVHAQVYDASGAKAGGELTVFSAATASPGTSFSVGDVAGLQDGSFVVTASTTWEIEPPHAAPVELALMGQHVGASGELIGAPVLVDSFQQQGYAIVGGPTFATPDGGWATISESVDWGIPPFGVGSRLHAFDAAGNATAESDGLVGSDSPLADQFANGNILLANLNWSPVSTSVGWEVVTPEGQMLATSRTSASLYLQQNSAAATVLASNIGVILWAQQDFNTNPATVTWHAQLVDEQGQVQGPEHTFAFGGGNDLRATALADGGFLLSWDQANSDGTLQLFGQHFDANANADGSVVLLDPSIAADSAFPATSDDTPYRIMATADGGFEVVSVDTGNDAAGDIVMTKFDAVPGSSNGNNPGQIAVNGNGGEIPSGNFVITGSAGLDTIALAGAHTDYDITPTSITSAQGTDTLSSIERVTFGDGFAVAFDTSGDAGQAYRLYQAAFDRAPDLPGLGYHINDLDHGVPLWLVAQHFIDSPEFQATYGTTDNTQFITLLYQNVLHRAPDTGGLQFHLGEFAQGESRADMLIHFSESPENQANVIGQIDNGMLYVPLAA